MLISNYDIFTEMIEEVIGGKVLKENLKDVFCCNRRIFYKMFDKGIPITSNSIHKISSFYSVIIDGKVQNWHEKEEIDRYFTNIEKMYNNYYFIDEILPNQILDVTTLILNTVANNKNIERNKLIYLISQQYPEIKFNNEGKICIENYEKIAHPQIISQFEASNEPFIGRTEDVKKLNSIISEYQYAIIIGEPGSGKYSLALKYAETFSNKYKNILCHKWQGSVDEIIYNISSSDDSYYTSDSKNNNILYESTQDRAKRKYDLLTQSGTDTLLIIYDVDSKLEMKSIKSLCKFGINIIITAKFTGITNDKKVLISPSKLSQDDYNQIFMRYFPLYNYKAFYKYIELIAQICNNNVYRFIFLMKMFARDNFKELEELYLYFENGNFILSDEMKKCNIEMSYHGEELEYCALKHLYNTMNFNLLDDLNKKNLIYLSLLSNYKTSYKSLSSVLRTSEKDLNNLNNLCLIEYDKKTGIIELPEINRWYISDILKTLHPELTDRYTNISPLLGQSLTNQVNLLRLDDPDIYYYLCMQISIYKNMLSVVTNHTYIFQYREIFQNINKTLYSALFDKVILNKLIFNINFNVNVKIETLFILLGCQLIFQGYFNLIKKDLIYDIVINDEIRAYLIILNNLKSILFGNWSEVENIYSKLKQFKETNDYYYIFVMIFILFIEYRFEIKDFKSSIKRYRQLENSIYHLIFLVKFLIFDNIKHDMLNYIYKEFYDDYIKTTSETILNNRNELNIVVPMQILEIIINHSFDSDRFSACFNNTNITYDYRNVLIFAALLKKYIPDNLYIQELIKKYGEVTYKNDYTNKILYTEPSVFSKNIRVETILKYLSQYNSNGATNSELKSKITNIINHIYDNIIQPNSDLNADNNYFDDIYNKTLNKVLQEMQNMIL